MIELPLTTAICNGRKHAELTYFEAFIYCMLLSVFYVASLYCLIPPKIRRVRNRDDPKQIQWRGFATSTVCIISVVSYGPMFCEPVTAASEIVPPIGVHFRSTITATCGVVFHMSILYFGVFVHVILRIYETLKKEDGKVTPKKLLSYLYLWHINPIYESIIQNIKMKRWIVLRNLVIAPITEEIVFRSCMVPVLMSTGMTVSYVCFVAPLFFGFAHLHHAAMKIHQGNPLASVVLTTFFQFLYTTLFGAYVAYAYQRSASTIAIVLCHSLCNFLGIPDVSFLQTSSSLYRSRVILLVSLILGFVGFIVCMTFYNLPPLIFTVRGGT